MLIPIVELKENNLKVDFLIKKIEDIYEKEKNNPPIPHQHDFYTIIWSINAFGKHTIDFEEHELKPNTIYFIHPEQVHQFIASEKPSGYVIMFTKEFLMRTGTPKMFIHQLTLLKEVGTPSVFNLKGRQILEISEIIEPLFKVYKEDSTFKTEKASAYITLLLISIFDNNPKTLIFLNNPIIDVLIDFKAKVDENYKLTHKVVDYARELGVESPNLNDAVRKFTGISAKEFIQKKILLEAKKLAYFSDLNTKEIGQILGFDDPSHFSKFFRSQTQITFSDFQKEKALN